MKIAFTGHRPNKLGNDYDLVSPLSNWIANQMRIIFTDKKPELVIVGMALGIDTLAAKTALQMDIPVLACIPCKNQEKMWPQKSKDVYYMILAHPLTITHHVSYNDYDSTCMQNRNMYMVDQLTKPEDRLIAIWDGSSGGTKNCVQYAIDEGKGIIQINPKNYHS